MPLQAQRRKNGHMEPSDRRARYVIVALFHQEVAGSSFSRQQWPVHVTVAPNFTTDVPQERLAAIVECTVTCTPPFSLRFTGNDLFGPHRDVPVLLVESESIELLHRTFERRLGELPDFTPDEPDFWGHGYRPHLTLRPTMMVDAQGSPGVHSVAVAMLREGEAEITASFVVHRTSSADHQ